jgi:hypothetical protein
MAEPFTLILCLITGVITFFAFRNPDLRERLLFRPETKMKTRSFVFSLLIGLPWPLLAAPDTSILIMRKNETTPAGETAGVSAQALIKSTAGDMRVSAVDLGIEEKGNLLKCSGDTTIFVAGRTIVGRDLTIALGDGKLTVYYLNPNGVVISRDGKKADDLAFPSGDPKAAFDAWKPGEPSPFVPAPAAKETKKP